MDKRIIKIATQVRMWAELVAEDEEYEENLCGLCARVSAKLFTELKKKGFDVKLAYTRYGFSHHCFVIYKDHLIDLTATQFKGIKESILIRRLPPLEMRYKFPRIFNSVEELTSYQKRIGWAEDQIPQKDELCH